MNSRIEVVRGFKVNGKVFSTEKEAEQYLFKIKLQDVVEHAQGGTINLLQAMLKNNITNRNSIRNLIKALS